MEILPSAPDPSAAIKQILPTESAPVELEDAIVADENIAAPPSVDSVTISPEGQSLAAATAAAPAPPETETTASPTPTQTAGSADATAAIQAFQDVAAGPDQSTERASA